MSEGILGPAVLRTRRSRNILSSHEGRSASEDLVLPSTSPSPNRMNPPQASNFEWPEEEDLGNRLRRSLHFGGKSVDFTKGSLEQSEDGAKRQPGGIRGLIRRTSISLKSRIMPRRNTTTAADAIYFPESGLPPSRWQTLRSAASFIHPRPTLESSAIPVDSVEDLGEAIPGSGNVPPVIPYYGRRGSAARVTAALQNSQLEKYERLGYLNPRPRHFEDPQNDHESGVGIAVSSTDESVATQVADQVSKVDFVNALPLELAILVLSNLDDVSLTKAALVSRKWNHVSSSGHVWREAYCRDWSNGYAISQPLKPGDGHGLPPVRPDMPWKTIHRARKQLKENWSRGNARHIYLTGHLDSIYCVQFDE